MDYEYLREFATTQRQLEVLDALESELSKKAAARKLGVHSTTIRDSLKSMKKRAAKSGIAPESGMTHQTATGFSTKRVSTMYSEAGTVRAQWHIQEPDKETQAQQMRDMLNALVQDIKPYKPIKCPKMGPDSEQLLNDIIIGDPHLDMLAYDKETGANWDSQIAYERHRNAVMNLLARAPNAATGMLTILGDSLHRDGMKAMTPGSGNMVDVDGRLGKSLETAVKLFREMIDAMLKTHQEVKVCFIRGNHSETLELALAMMLRIAYEREPRLDVLDNTSKHIPFAFGDNFLLTTHGDKLNDQKKADIAVSLFRKQHGNAAFTHVRCGHVHHTSQKEVSGCLVETFQALPTPDAWHYESGYVTSDQSVSMLTYHRLGGICSRLIEYPRIFMAA